MYLGSYTTVPKQVSSSFITTHPTTSHTQSAHQTARPVPHAGPFDLYLSQSLSTSGVKVAGTPFARTRKLSTVTVKMPDSWPDNQLAGRASEATYPHGSQTGIIEVKKYSYP